MKQSFSLIEVVISVVLFGIIISALMQNVESMKNSNKSHLAIAMKQQTNLQFQKTIFSDLINAKFIDTNITIVKNKNILTFKSSNTYHNPFKTHISYFVSKEKNFIRAECANALKIDDKFDSYKYFDNCYIDILKSNVEIFEPIKIEKSNQINLFIKFSDGDIINFGVNQIF